MSKHAFIETELGLLPDDWQIVKLGEIGSFYKGAGISREDSHSGSIPAVRYGEIYTTHDNYIFKCTSFISPLIAKQSRRIHKGYILFTGSGETKEDIGKAVAFVDDYEAYAGGDIIILSPKKAYDPLYLGFFLNSSPVIRQRASLAQGDSVVHITAEALKEIRLALPPIKEEQTRIASALFDIDTLIRDLDRTIEKKQNIKLGAMQELLTSKKRLKGFTEEWKEKSLEEMGFLTAGGTPSTMNPEYWGGDINWLQSGAVQNCLIMPDAVEKKITEAGLQNSSAYLIRSNSVLIAITGATCANVGYLTFESAANQSVVSVEPYEDYDAMFLYQKLLTEKNTILSNKGGSAQSGVTLKALKQLTILVPPSIQEQRAIADLLTAMDDEIAMLQLERTKYANIRSGMMDDLLSGTKRL